MASFNNARTDKERLTIDGSLGEGGGQILRTSLSLSALSGRPFRLENIRAGRSKPGLRPQHLTAVRAAAAICGATLSGDEVNSTTLEFVPQHQPQAGRYRFDVREASGQPSAGATTLILQTVLWPLLFADAPSMITIRGGTHVNFSPSFHYLQMVSFVSYRAFGIDPILDLQAYGWMPKGEGQISMEIKPIGEAGLTAAEFLPEECLDVSGIALSTELPSHIPHRMARRADNVLSKSGLRSQIQVKRFRGDHDGAGIFLWLKNGRAGGAGLGRPGHPSDKVADDACKPIRQFVKSGAGVDEYLADQLLLPAALAHGTTRIDAQTWSPHSTTNATLLKTWLGCEIDQSDASIWAVTGIGFTPATPV